MIFWLLKWVLLGPVVRLFARPVVIGRQHLPADGPVILAPSHHAEIDSLVLSLVSPRRPTFVAKREYFDAATLRGRADRWLCTVTGQIALDRNGGDAALRALDAARELLSNGGVWAIYPEGRRSPDGRLHRGHTGVMRVALSVPEVVVIPVGLHGTAAVDAPGRRGWRRGRVRVTFGAPLDLDRWRLTPDDPTTWRAATDHLMGEIRALTGQEYVDGYAERRLPEAG
ncbi:MULTISPECIES: lysophospholipid acyltransferase family protein [unclassified Nocardioides]|uniref:lysophospholipid acyltransferase family protein n=1 Tax=unclassified Nocardioides TaxID=2615069 RepID=UPI0006F79462|nr:MULTISPECIES: lysophospholipid acyltransferase family protein [unclassified Nocardioides]KQY57274.1 hypothetical protein ASD30_13655 [Nocardioides sp. Root140]KQZ68787.1 hypothetical protein ASD66_16095 [Nocardioides sp. Root151]